MNIERIKKLEEKIICYDMFLQKNNLKDEFEVFLNEIFQNEQFFDNPQIQTEIKEEDEKVLENKSFNKETEDSNFSNENIENETKKTMEVKENKQPEIDFEKYKNVERYEPVINLTTESKIEKDLIIKVDCSKVKKEKNYNKSLVVNKTKKADELIKMVLEKTKIPNNQKYYLKSMESVDFIFGEEIIQNFEYINKKYNENEKIINLILISEELLYDKVFMVSTNTMNVKETENKTKKGTILEKKKNINLEPGNVWESKNKAKGVIRYYGKVKKDENDFDWIGIGMKIN
jgi:hypothetical protein